jgi:hypothetical protein
LKKSELQADRENQYCHSESREELNPLSAGDHPWRVWPDHDPSDEVAHDEWLTQQLTDDGSQRGEAHHQRHISRKLPATKEGTAHHSAKGHPAQ